MVNLLDELREEHQKILGMLEEKRDIREIIEFVEKVHHPKEEIQLFPHIATHPLVSEGGPRCTFFKGMEIDMDLLGPARRRLKDYYAAGGPKPPSYREFSWWNPQNPIDVPMGEHALGHALAHALLFLLEEGNQSLRAVHFDGFRRDYEDLMRLHINKEDTCLFVMCERLLPRLGR